ncbi:hypothetical protein [Pantoea sp. Mhis]|nr:hypothetical protein [Pantoea sp. Mhis]
MLHALKNSDILISRIVEPLARYDSTITHFYLIEKANKIFY